MIVNSKVINPNTWQRVFIFWPRRIHCLIDQFEHTQAKFDPELENKLVKKVYSCWVFCQTVERRYHVQQGTFRGVEHRLIPQ